LCGHWLDSPTVPDRLDSPVSMEIVGLATVPVNELAIEILTCILTVIHKEHGQRHSPR
jgi:hypothetical protein